MKKPEPQPQQPINIFLLGGPGAGKATQARLLVKKYGLLDLDMGVLQLRARQNDKSLNKLYAKTVDVGKMAPTQAYRKLLSKTLQKVPSTASLLFDGHPKMPGEVRFVRSLLRSLGRTRSVCVYLEIPWKETLKRNSKRAGYVKGHKRPDDSPEAIQRRYYNARAWIEKSKPWYEKFYPTLTVSGLGTVRQVEKRIDRALKKLLQLYEKRHPKN